MGKASRSSTHRVVLGGAQLYCAGDANRNGNPRAFMIEPSLKIRLATMADVPALQELIAQSVRGLSAGIYSAEQIETALADVFGVDTQLIDDETYFVIVDHDRPAAAGGWSGRRTLFGGSHMQRSDGDPRLDPAIEAARIRAFFVHPDYARRGLARQLYDRCAQDARAAGFRSFELMATMPGKPLYEALGFTPIEAIALPMHGDVVLPLLHMGRAI